MTGLVADQARIHSVVVGDGRDEHAAAVTALLPPNTWVAFDAASLAHQRYLLRHGELWMDRHPDAAGDLVRLGPGCRGWLRRFAPPDWQRGVVLDSRDAVVKTAWLTLLTGFARTSRITWLTQLDQLNRAEGKLTQYDAAAQLGIPVPEAFVTSDPALLREHLGPRLVIKPLGPGHFVGEDGAGRVVFATEVLSDAPFLECLAGAPFLAQRLVDARTHLRVVTVEQDVWACGVDAEKVPFDWRRRSAAQRSFMPVRPPAEVTVAALRLAGYFDLGYSSQDWILDRSGQPWFLDLNPSGQWLFLPEPVASAVTGAIAGWLRGTAQ